MHIVITTINPKTKAVRKLETMGLKNIVLTGDAKSVYIENSSSTIFLSLKDQTELGFEYVRLAPKNHYSRKNIGYLYSIKKGATEIWDLDDDNIVDELTIPDSSQQVYEISSKENVVNVYSYFCEEKIWPRGYPLRYIGHSDYRVDEKKVSKVDIWQVLVNKDPDVDAIHRLVFNKEVHFKNKKAVTLKSENYCPINSQNTYWSKYAFPLLYLPATVSFRFTDILRGYIAQKLLWIDNRAVGYFSPNAVQERNDHDLLSDFSQEIEMYKKTDKLVDFLKNFRGKPSDSLFNNLKKIYSGLVQIGVVGTLELELLESWQKDYESLTS